MIHEDERNPGRAGGFGKENGEFFFCFQYEVHVELKVLSITNELSLL